jgi:hypothetical protein
MCVTTGKRIHADIARRLFQSSKDRFKLHASTGWGTCRPDHSHTPAIERLVPNHVVEDPLAFPLDPLFGDPAGGHQHDRQEAPAN